MHAQLHTYLYRHIHGYVIGRCQYAVAFSGQVVSLWLFSLHLVIELELRLGKVNSFLLCLLQLVGGDWSLTVLRVILRLVVCHDGVGWGL